MDQMIAVLSPITRTDSDSAAFNSNVTKNYECYGCVIRIMQQEIGKNYSSYSCADVNIVNEIPDGDTCLHNGKRKYGICECDTHSSGDNCQYHDECIDEKIAVIMEDVLISQSFMDDSEFLPTLYQMREVGEDNDKIYWRILQNEIEFVLKFKTDSWVGIGWKPKNPDEYCPSLRNIESQEAKLSDDLITTSSWWTSDTTTTTEEITTITNEAFSSQSISNKQSSHSQKNIKIEKICGENEEFSHCPEYTRQCEASCDWTKFPETIPNCPRACGTPKCVCKEGFVRSANDNNTCVPFDYCSDEAEIECPINSTWAKCGIACEPTCENMYDTSPCPASCDEPACTSTVVETESLTCGINETINECGRACETNCSNVYAREKCTQCFRPACACIHGYARLGDRCVYWANCPRESRRVSSHDRQHNPQSLPRSSISSVITTGENSNGTESMKSFLKSSNNSRIEIRELNLTDTEAFVKGVNVQSQNISNAKFSTLLESDPGVVGDVCYGDWRWPPDCRDCDYRISWNYLDDTDEIEFSIETRAPSNWWTGVGFSPTGTMVEADIIIVKSRNGELSLHDMYSTEYGVPREDSKQDVYTPTVIGTHVNGVLRVQFTRKRDTGDRKADHHFSETNCYKFLFPVSGGRLEPDGQLSKHISIPHVSEEKICIQSCTAPQNLQATSSCDTEYRYPAGCSDTACDYIAKWEYNMARKDVKFEISSKELGRWTGIGFSRDGQMANSDIYIGWVFEGKAYVTDRFAYGRQLPAIDPADRQDIYEIGGKAEDDIQTITFRRKILPADTITDFPLNLCYYFLFPIGGGRVLARKSQDFQNAKTPIGYHDLYQPKISRTKICICDQNGVSIASNDGPPAVRHRRRINEMNMPYRRKRQSQDPFDIQIDPFQESIKLRKNPEDEG
ncbi:Teneurin-a [Dirofilaria immitis]|nr:Teneurin-a [Dirofilaria immitis]